MTKKKVIKALTEEESAALAKKMEKSFSQLGDSALAAAASMLIMGNVIQPHYPSPRYFTYNDMELLRDNAWPRNRYDIQMPTGSDKLDMFLRDEWQIQYEWIMSTADEYLNGSLPMSIAMPKHVAEVRFASYVMDSYTAASKLTYSQRGGESGIMHDVAAAVRRLYYIFDRKLPRMALYNSPFDVALAESQMTGVPLHNLMYTAFGHDRARRYDQNTRRQHDELWKRVGGRWRENMQPERRIVTNRIESILKSRMSNAIVETQLRGVHVTPGIVLGYYEADRLGATEVEHVLSDPRITNPNLWMAHKLMRFICQRVSAIAFGSELIALSPPPTIRMTVGDDKLLSEAIKKGRGDQRLLDRLHSMAGPALSWRSGDYSEDFYIYHGWVVPSNFILEPEKLTAQQAVKEKSAELRRIMIEIMGVEKFLAGGKSKVINKDEFGTLLEVRLGNDNDDRWNVEIRRVLQVTNATPNPDGTYKDYFLFVPPTMSTAHEAVAWTFYTTPALYKPIKQA